MTLTLTVSFPIYLLALMSFIGWFLFVLFAGVGLSALPIDLILEWKNRPILVILIKLAFLKTSCG